MKSQAVRHRTVVVAGRSCSLARRGKEGLGHLAADELREMVQPTVFGQVWVGRREGRD
jgi:hypothetical protein